MRTLDCAVAIPVQEWHDAFAVVALARRLGVAEGLGCVHLSVVAGRRRWFAADGVEFVCLMGGQAAQHHEPTLIPVYVLDAALRLRPDENGDVTLVIDTENQQLVVQGEGVRSSFPLQKVVYPDVDVVMERYGSHEGTSRVVDVRQLQQLAKALCGGPQADDDVKAPAVIGISAVGVKLISRREDRAHHLIAAPGEEGHFVEFDAERLARLITPLREGEVEVTVPALQGHPLRFASGDWTLFLFPYSTLVERARERLEQLLNQTFGTFAVVRNGEGDYPLTSYGSPVYARLIDGDPIRVRVFGPVLLDVDREDGLLEELNSYNENLPFARTYFAGRTVHAVADLVAATLDPDELMITFARVRHLVDELGPLLLPMFGGRRPIDGQDELWEAFTATIVEAPVDGGEWKPLSGPDAVALPSSPVHVISAWNPSGRPMLEARNHEANERLLVHLIRSGAVVRPALGRDRDGEQMEASFLVEHMTRDEALAVGRVFDQAAIFELDEEALHVLACDGSRTLIAARTS